MLQLLLGVEFNAFPSRHNPGHFGGGLLLTNKTVQENVQTKYNSKSKQRKIQKNETAYFNGLLRHSARKRGGLIVYNVPELIRGP